MSREIFNLTNASSHRLNTLGLVTFTVTLGDYKFRVQFAVVLNLVKISFSDVCTPTGTSKLFDLDIELWNSEMEQLYQS